MPRTAAPRDENGFPLSFKRATWRGCIPGRGTGDIGVSVDMDSGETVRLRMTAQDAAKLAGAIDHCLSLKACHSPISSGSPHVDGSIPDEGQKV